MLLKLSKLESVQKCLLSFALATVTICHICDGLMKLTSLCWYLNNPLDKLEVMYKYAATRQIDYL